MKNILLALVCLVTFSFKNYGDDRPKCCTDKCSKECIEMCKKNKCTDKDCATKGCKGKTCTSADKHASCCATADECKKKCAEGKCTDKCKVADAKAEGACCKKEHK